MTTSGVTVRRLFLDRLDVSELFTEFIELFDISVTTRIVDQEFNLLQSKLYLQRIRLVIWGEALGLVPNLEQSSDTNQFEALQPALIEIINDFYQVVDNSGVFIEQFQLTNDDLRPPNGYEKQLPTTLTGLPIFYDRYENVKERHKRFQLAQNFTWTLRRWTVYDLKEFAVVVDKLQDLLDTLEATTSSWGTLEQQQTLLREEICLIDDSSSLQYLGEIMNSRQLSQVLLVVPETVKHALARIGTPANSHNATSTPTDGYVDDSDSSRGLLDMNVPLRSKATQSKADVVKLLPNLIINLNGITIQSIQSVASRFGPAHIHCFPFSESSLTILNSTTVASVKTSDLCDACSHISLPMLIHGFRHALEYQEVLRNMNCCRFCALMMHGYNTQICMNHTKRSCEKNSNDRLTWKIVPPGPGARTGVFRLDLFHHGQPNSIHISEDSSLFKNQILTRRDVQVADSPRNFRLLHDWLEDCGMGHDDCQYGSYSGQRFDDVSGTTTLPFRVIDISFVSDKSNALKGLEERLVTRHGARFVSGLLDFGPKEVIHSQLLWIPMVSRGISLRGSLDFVCPTWSWMIINGSVRWTSIEYVALTEAISDTDFDMLDANGTELLHISGPCQAVVIGDSADKTSQCSRSERRQPGISDWPALMLDSGSRSLLSVDDGEVIGWAVLDSSDEPPNTIAVPLLQRLRIDDEDEPMCIELLLLAKVPIVERSVRHENLEGHYRVGRGRVFKDAFAWLENCQKDEFIVV